MPSVFIIEESNPIVQQLEFLLHPMGFSTTRAVEVAEVFGQRGKSSKLRDNPSDMVLLSMNMTEMSAFDILDKMQNMVHIKDIPVILVANTASDAQAVEAKYHGAKGFVTKPISADKLFTEIARVAQESGLQEVARILSGYLDLGRRAEKERAELKVGDANLSYLMEIIDEDEDLLRELVRALVEDMPGQLEKIEKAIAQKDPNKLAVSAHLLKGSIANFGAALITAQALALEKAGRSGDLNGVERQFRTLKEDAERLRRELIAWMAF